MAIYDWQKEAMPVTRPQYVDQYIEGIAPGEQHEHPDRTGRWLCLNPKCLHNFTPGEIDEAEWQGALICPKCGTDQRLDPFEEYRPLYTPTEPEQEGGKPYQLDPGGKTRAGIGIKEMGDIAEEVVKRIGELPGVGTVTAASDDYNFPIDVIVQSDRGGFGCEIKGNHSQAQERFKIGGKKERQDKIAYCLANGLKPALIGVRLNFYTDKAYVFFREGLTDTWIGNNKMLHIGTYDFSDLNPFKSPDPEAQALAVQNANLPDQSEEGLDPFSASEDPDYLYVYYGSELHVEPYSHNTRFEDLLDNLLAEFGLDMSHQAIDIDPTEVDAGEIYQRGESIQIEHKQLNDPTVRTNAEMALRKWWSDKQTEDWFSWTPALQDD